MGGHGCQHGHSEATCVGTPLSLFIHSSHTKQQTGHHTAQPEVISPCIYLEINYIKLSSFYFIQGCIIKYSKKNVKIYIKINIKSSSTLFGKIGLISQTHIYYSI